MTSEAIKALMLFGLYGALQIALHFSLINRFAKQPLRLAIRPTANRKSIGRAAED
jgi:hypothetical protein